MKQVPLDGRKNGREITAFTLCELREFNSLDEVVACLEALCREQPEAGFFCLLDDEGQCTYTSGHAMEKEGLSLDEEVDYENPEAYRAYKRRELAHIQERLKLPADQRSWQDLLNTRSEDPDHIEALLKVNRDPMVILLENEPVYVQRLPETGNELLISGMPNGYFVGDWNVFENYALICHLSRQHGYRFFGIGASWLGFVRDKAPRADEANALVKDLADLYAGDAEDEAWQELAEVLQNSRLLLLGYTENFTDNVLD